MQELLLARPRPATYWFTETHASDGVRFPLNSLAIPAKHTRTHTSLVECLLGHTGIEQLLLNCNISTKTTRGACGRKDGKR